MEKNTRRFLGMACLAILIASFISFSGEPRSVEIPASSIHDSSFLDIWDKIGMFFMAVWICLSIEIKATMIFGKKIKALNIASLSVWILVLFAANLSDPSSSAYSALSYLIGALLVFGWPIVDAIDLYFIKKEEKK